MEQATYSKIWDALSKAFKLIQNMLQQTLPGLKMTASHHHNEAFLFRAYAEYSLNERVIAISFDIQEKEGLLHVWGDISQEDGHILKDIMDTTIECVDCDLLQLATQFASQCLSEMELIKTVLV